MNMNKEEILSTIQEIAEFCKTIERRKEQYDIGYPLKRVGKPQIYNFPATHKIVGKFHASVFLTSIFQEPTNIQKH